MLSVCVRLSVVMSSAYVSFCCDLISSGVTFFCSIINLGEKVFHFFVDKNCFWEKTCFQLSANLRKSASCLGEGGLHKGGGHENLRKMKIAAGSTVLRLWLHDQLISFFLLFSSEYSLLKRQRNHERAP